MFKKFQALTKGGKYAYEMLVPKISKNLKKFQENKDDIIKSTDKYTKSAKTEEDKIKLRKPVGPALGKLSKITQQFPEKKAKGGRIGLKRGTGLPKKKSNVDKIKKTFGTLSVRAGIDKNPNPTYADKIAGAKMKNKNKKVI
tara:strand:+ start:42 stop:467 length:426 start_codon:yes stop_codon:yes gene_type:complete